MTNNTQKSWLSPFMAVTYFAVATTGLLMLFHLKFPGVHSIHKWGGFIFIIGGLIHLILNWPIFVSHFKKSKAIWGTLIGILALIIIAITAPSKEYNQRYYGGIKSPIHYGGGLRRR